MFDWLLSLFFKNGRRKKIGNRRKRSKKVSVERRKGDRRSGKDRRKEARRKKEIQRRVREKINKIKKELNDPNYATTKVSLKTEEKTIEKRRKTINVAGKYKAQKNARRYKEKSKRNSSYKSKWGDAYEYQIETYYNEKENFFIFNNSKFKGLEDEGVDLISYDKENDTLHLIQAKYYTKMLLTHDAVEELYYKLLRFKAAKRILGYSNFTKLGVSEKTKYKLYLFIPRPHSIGKLSVIFAKNNGLYINYEVGKINNKNLKRAGL